MGIFSKNKNTIRVTIDLSPEAIEKRKQEKQEELKNRWKYTEPQIEYYYSDGTPSYKTDWVNGSEREQIGFLSIKNYSKNKKYCLVIVKSNDYAYNVAVVNVEKQVVLFRLKLDEPSNGTVSNEGVSVVVESKGKGDQIVILEKNGDVKFSKRHNYLINHTPFEFIENETKFMYETCTNYKKFKIDV